ncbi:uncharacterized protein LOC143020791 [Oratosquilla oratoria]|uniref:uncharacterized protein LOC143020791 n=1 Tax=Oratosquilla oratoria TaxID=337810 RepID=UPI003F77579A
MTRRGKYLLKPLSVGQCATLRVPDVDRGPTDPKNLLVVVLKENDGLHTVGCREGIIGPKFTAPDLYEEREDLDDDDTNAKKEKTVNVYLLKMKRLQMKTQK